MLGTEEKKFFNENGYLLVPGVLSAAEVSQLRKRTLEIFRSGEWKRSPFNTERVLSDVYTTFPEFIRITLKKEVLDCITGLLGKDPVLMPETAVHYRFYTGWHKDTTSQERAGYRFHLDAGALMVEAGFYLQDNDEHGGGLTVMPGSHRTADPFLEPAPSPGLLARVRRKLFGYSEKSDTVLNPHRHEIVDIPSRAGDMVIFNFMLNHRATKPANGRPDTVPPEKEKLAFFNAFSARHPSADEYLRYIYSREEPFYRHIRSVPRHEELIRYSREHGFTVY